ncbi:MAG: desulfoferrodoxin family protein [Desulfobacterales bacterium]|nr:desulfoferrodoxin family protein [Desulfobacterales bacterium]
MKIKRVGILMAVMVLVITFCSGVSLADKSAVTIEAPDQAAKGTEITVKIHITHSANNYFHYTNWVKVIVNGKDAALWEYSAGNRPEDAKFTKEIKLTVTEPMEIVAEANCNLHGGQGPAKKMIQLQ